LNRHHNGLIVCNNLGSFRNFW